MAAVGIDEFSHDSVTQIKLGHNLFTVYFIASSFEKNTSCVEINNLRLTTGFYPHTQFRLGFYSFFGGATSYLVFNITLFIIEIFMGQSI